MSDDSFKKLHLEILPPAQRQLWDELRDIPKEFTLYGGTAIALYLNHRQSVDFDLFGCNPFNSRQLYDQISFLKNSKVIQEEPNTLTCIVDRGEPVQVSFFGVPGIRPVAKPYIVPDNGLKIASLIDLAGMKATLVQQRAEAKDYMDLSAMIERKVVDLPTALSSAQRIYPSFEPTATLKALCYYGDGNLSTVPEKDRLILITAVRTVDLNRLPNLGIASE